MVDVRKTNEIVVRFVETREKKGFSLGHTAQKLCLDKGCLSRYERGQLVPTKTVLEKMALFILMHEK